MLLGKAGIGGAYSEIGGERVFSEGRSCVRATGGEGVDRRGEGRGCCGFADLEVSKMRTGERGTGGKGGLCGGDGVV
jgi:hypothetical protein